MNAATNRDADVSATELSSGDLAVLAEVATRSVLEAVGQQRRFDPDLTDFPPALRRPGAVFVTLRRGGALRGCIGTMEPVMPLVHAVADRARAAAFDDPRFPPVSRGELRDLQVEVSVLTPMESFSVAGYDELVATVRPSVDGLLVEAGFHRATFLPAVWEQLPRPAEFVAALWHKAGLPPRAWPQGIATWRYRAQHSTTTRAGVDERHGGSSSGRSG
jgi:AmmeMemoRadiSam system protein A